MEEDFFINKYTPKDLNSIEHNTKTAKHLLKLSKLKNIPHIILYGPQHSGKKLFVNLFLQEKYGKSIFNVKSQTIDISNSNKSIFRYYYSKYHFFIMIKDYSVYDRLIIQTFIKDISKTKNILCDYHIIVIDKAEKLNIDAQQSLLRTMEKHVVNCRFILLVNSEHDLIDPLKSRFVHLRIKKPTNTDLNNILNNISNQEINHSTKIFELCDKKISNVINFYELLCKRYNNTTNLEQIYYDHNLFAKNIKDLINMLFKENDLMFLKDANELLNDILIHSTDPDGTMKRMFKEILCHKEIDEKTLLNIITITDNSYANLTNHNKPIYHIMDYYVKLFEAIKIMFKDRGYLGYQEYQE